MRRPHASRATRGFGIAWSVLVLAAAVGIVPAHGQGTCPAPATVTVFVDNRSADAAVRIHVDGELVDAAATCAGAGDVAYEATLDCTGTGLVACGTLPSLRPGAWIDRLAVTVAGSQAQVQARRDVFVAGGAPTVNQLAWPVYPRTFVVTEATATNLKAQLDAAAAYTSANPGPALVTFLGAAFPGADAPQRIDLPRTTCVPDPPRAAALCLTGSRVVVDALDARGRPGGVIWSVGTRAISVLRLYGGDDVFRGLVLEGSAAPSPTAQSDAVVVTGAGALRNRLEQSIVVGPTSGDGISVQDAAGRSDDGGDAIAVDGCEIDGARDRGVVVTADGEAVVARSCVHDNRNGGLLATAGGRLTAVRNVVQRNLPGSAAHGIVAAGTGAAESTRLVTDGNVVRFAGGRGISVGDDARATIRNDYVADNEFVGAKVETTAAGTPGTTPQASFTGTALVCNRNGAVSGSCHPQATDEGVPCTTDADCCGIPDGCCVNDAGCASPLACQPAFPIGLGAAIAAAPGRDAPVATFGTADAPGHNAFTWNRKTAQGANFLMNVDGGAVSAVGNEWQSCGTGSSCVVGDVLTSDVRLAPGATVDLGVPLAPRDGAPVLAGVVPARPRKGELVRVYGDRFNAVEGTACASEASPADPCSADNAAVRAQNQQTNAMRLRVQKPDGTVLQTLWPDAVTPTMLAFQMPFDCFAPLVLQVAKRDPGGNRLLATIPLCGAETCAGQPAGLPCDDGNACTANDACTGGPDGVCAGTPVTCAGACLTGACDAQLGCLPKPASAACDDGNVCTIGDHCDGTTSACVAGTPRACSGDCLTGACDAVAGCVPKAAGTVCRPAVGTCDQAEACDGATAACPPDVRKDAGTVCRAAAGPCDVAETCNGTSAACPVNAYKPSTVVCRPAAGVCDVAESCPGTGPFCPDDAKRTSVCRPAVGVCDVAEQCDGTSNDCPPDGFAPPTTVCRTAVGPCDVAETCTGSGPACPTDAIAPAGTVCRAAAGPCDVAERCSGSATTCPADQLLSAAAACEDGDACTVGDHCGGGTASCVPGTARPCDDGDACTVDGCDVVAGCTHRALLGMPRYACLANECARTRPRRVLLQVIGTLEQSGRPPTARQMRRLRKLLARCGVSPARF